MGETMNFIAFNFFPACCLNVGGRRLLTAICGLLLALTQLSRGEAVITSPAVPAVRSVAAVCKAGVAINLLGNADGAAFQRFYVEWAKGINPVSGWTNTGITLTGDGLSPITGGTLASWDSTNITQADFHSIRLRVAETSITNT